MTGSNKSLDWLSVNIALAVFFVSYFLTVVLGDIVYILSSTRSFLEESSFTALIFGAAPAAVHITSYALDGWPLAAIGLFCASVLLGIFAALPLGGSSLAGSMAVTGGVIGYHLSQLPGEGPIFYDHGVFWTIVMLFVCTLVVKSFRGVIAK